MTMAFVFAGVQVTFWPLCVRAEAEERKFHHVGSCGVLLVDLFQGMGYVNLGRQLY